MQALKEFAIDYFRTYETKRKLKIHRKRISVVNILSKIFVLFVIGAIIVFQYFVFGQLRRVAVISSSLTTKVKGLGYANNVTEFLLLHDEPEITFDTADYVIPANEKDALFIMTNFITTRQSRGVCDEDPTTAPNVVCKNNSDCLNQDFTRWNGKPTGLCVQSTRNASLDVCQINAWCPVENDVNPNNIIQNVYNYTIFVKSTVEFKEFDKIERNIQPYMTNDYLSTCTRSNDSLCPIFRLGDLIDIAEPSVKNQQQMLSRGGVIKFDIIWKCDYSPHIRGKCLPEYKFSRFDGEPQPGFNFRYADKYISNDTAYRNLNKVYGLRIIITTTGQALKPDVIGILIAFLAFSSLFSISLMVTDFYIFNCYSTKEDRRAIEDLIVENDENNPYLRKVINPNYAGSEKSESPESK